MYSATINIEHVVAASHESTMNTMQSTSTGTRVHENDADIERSVGLEPVPSKQLLFALVRHSAAAEQHVGKAWTVCCARFHQSLTRVASRRL